MTPLDWNENRGRGPFGGGARQGRSQSEGGAARGDAAPPRKHEEHESQTDAAEAELHALALGGDLSAVCAAKTRRSWFLHLQQLLVRLVDSADWIWARFIFIRRPSVLPASNIDETHTEYLLGLCGKRRMQRK